MVLREVVRLSPRSAFAYTNLGQAYRLMGKFQDAINSLQEALRISPTDSVAYNYLGLTYESLDPSSGSAGRLQAGYCFEVQIMPRLITILPLLHLALGDRSQARNEYVILKALTF